MENLKDLAPLLNILPLVLVFVMWTKFDKLWTAVDEKTSKKYADDTFQRGDLCDVTHKAIDEKLNSIQADLKTLVDRR